MAKFRFWPGLWRGRHRGRRSAGDAPLATVVERNAQAYSDLGKAIAALLSARNRQRQIYENLRRAYEGAVSDENPAHLQEALDRLKEQEMRE